MKSLSLAIVILLSSYSASAIQLKCHTLINLEEVAVSVVETKINQRVIVQDGTEAVSYITEKNDGLYSLESYLYNYDMRIYSEGPITSERSLSLSAWTRDVIYEVKCQIK